MLLVSDNTWNSSLIRNDYHVWLHKNDRILDNKPNLKSIIIEMDKHQLELIKLVALNSHNTQCQLTFFAGSLLKDRPVISRSAQYDYQPTIPIESKELPWNVPSQHKTSGSSCLPKQTRNDLCRTRRSKIPASVSGTI